MKRFVCLTLVLAALFCLMTSCDLAQNLADNILDNLEGNIKSSSKIDDMMAALAEGRADDAKALMHPENSFYADEGIKQMIDFLDGRTPVSKEGTGVSINANASTSGSERMENVSYKVTLSDGSSIHVNAIYLEDQFGEGFTYFQISIGIPIF